MTTPPVNDPTAGLPPELVNHPRYQVLRELGRGGMGVVYHARQTMMDREVAIKVISKALLDHPDALERFQREVRAAARLLHPNIVAAHDAERAGDLHMLVMEYVEGHSLADVLRRKGPLPIAYACSYVRQAALGLQHAHDKGMVHRDIKPHNLMLTPKGQVKILDFGLAKLASESRAGQALTATNCYMGTPEYSAPEQATDARSADIRADLYSLGCTLYYLLAGAPPFQGASAVQTIMAHMQTPPQPLPELRPDVPPALWQVVARLLAKTAEERYQTPAELARALAPFCKPGTKSAPAALPVATPAASPGQLTAVPAETSPTPVALPVRGGKTPRKEAVTPTARKVVPARPVRKAVPPPRRGWPVLGIALAVLATLTLLGCLVVGVFCRGALGPVGGGAASGRGGNSGGPAEAAGFVPLFNGTDLTGWTVDGGDQNAWEVKDGELVATGSDEDDYTTQGYLLTDRDFGDFILRFEFKQVDRAEASTGVALRAVPRETFTTTIADANDATPFHLTVWLGELADAASQGKPGALWWSPNTEAQPMLLPDQLADLQKVGDWNRVEVELQGQSLRVAINGRDVQKVQLNKTRPQQNPAPGLTRFAGRLGLLKRTGEVHFRSIEVKELKPAPPPPPPEGDQGK